MITNQDFHVIEFPSLLKILGFLSCKHWSTCDHVKIVRIIDIVKKSMQFKKKS